MNYPAGLRVFPFVFFMHARFDSRAFQDSIDSVKHNLVALSASQRALTELPGSQQYVEGGEHTLIIREQSERIVQEFLLLLARTHLALDAPMGDYEAQLTARWLMDVSSNCALLT